MKKTPEEFGRLYVYSDYPGLAVYLVYVPDPKKPEHNHFEFLLYQDGKPYCRGSMAHWFCIPMEEQFQKFSIKIAQMYRDGTLPKPNPSSEGQTP